MTGGVRLPRRAGLLLRGDASEDPLVPRNDGLAEVLVKHKLSVGWTVAQKRERGRGRGRGRGPAR